MRYDEVVLRELCATHAVSGMERRQFSLIEGFLEKASQNIKIQKSPIGNIWGTFGMGKFTVLIEAHGDEVGFMVSRITESGRLKFVCIGGSDPKQLINQPVKIFGAEEIDGLIIQTEPGSGNGLDMGSLSIEIGQKSKTEVEKLGIKPGDTISFARNFQTLGKANDLVISPGLDNKVGITATIKAARIISETIGYPSPKITYVFAITSQHEQGNHRGLTGLLHKIKPDFALVIDSAYAQPFPAPFSKTGNWNIPVIGRGPAIEPIGQGFILSETMRDFLSEEIAKWQKNQPGAKRLIQYEVPDNRSGGTNITGVYNRYDGIPSATINIPVAQQHSPTCMASLKDIEQAGTLIAHLALQAKPFITEKWRL